MDNNTIKVVKVRTEKHKRSTEELILAAKEKDAKMDRSRKTLTKAEKADKLLEEMMTYSSTQHEEVEEVLKPMQKSAKWDVKIGDPIEFFDPTLSYELTGYRPITKDFGLDFDPKWFTEAADFYLINGRYTKMVPNTFGWIQHWKEEFDRCQNGYTVNGYRLTGLNYFFLNYYRLLSPLKKKGDKNLSKRAESFPVFIAKLYEYFHYLELSKKVGLDALIFKSRGIGASEIAASNCVHAYTFIRDSYNIVTGFLEKYVRTTLRKAWQEMDFLNLRTEGAFKRLRMKIDTDMKKVASLVDKHKNEFGWKSTLEGIVADTPDKLRGDRVDNIYFEESGNNRCLIETYERGEALVNILGSRVGLRVVFGTSGQSGPNLEGLEKMFFNPDGYTILPFYNRSMQGAPQLTGYFIPSYSMWLGDPVGTGFDERGVVDEEKAKAWYIKSWEKITDSHSLLIKKAEYCFTPEDAFVLEGENQFDQELLEELYQNLTIHKTVAGPQACKLYWNVNTDNGEIDYSKRPRVEFCSDGPLKILELPKLDPDGQVYSNLYVAGGDLIDLDSTTSTGLKDVSEYCVIIYRRSFGLEPPKPVAIYKERPKYIKNAFEMTMKLCSFYNSKILVEATRISIKTYFQEKGFLHYMMKRPLATANSSKRTNFRQYGVPATEAVILHQLELIELYIVDYYDQLQFPELLLELIKYSYANKRKFDMVAAFAMALLADEDMFGKTARSSGIVKDNFINLSYYRNEYGQLEFGVSEQPSSRTESLTDDLWSLW